MPGNYWYKLQHWMAITRHESQFLLVFLFLLLIGLIAQQVYDPRHPAPDAHARAELQFQEHVAALGQAEMGGVDVLADSAQHMIADSPSPAPSTTATGLVDLNSASASQLQQLPGIGPALAERIIGYRSTVGTFRRADELLNVRGIGPRTFEALEPLIQAGADS